MPPMGLGRSLVALESGEDPVQGLLDFAKRERLSSGHFTAIGAFEDVTIGYFELARARTTRGSRSASRSRCYPLVGDVALEGDVPRFTPTWSWASGTAPRTAAHLLEARVRPTLEVILVQPPDTSRAASTPGPSWRSSISRSPGMTSM